MKIVESHQDVLDGAITVDLQNGKFVRLYRRDVREYGFHTVLQAAVPGYQPPTGRVPVFQSGRQLGTLPATFDPYSIRSRSFLYDPRPGDFIREGDRWVANPMLGPGDLDVVPGFERGHRPTRGDEVG